MFEELLTVMFNTDRKKRWCRPEEQSEEDAPFCLLLKKCCGIPLGPKCTLQIPISYAPFTLCQTETDCEIVARREDGVYWQEETCPSSSCQSR